MRGMEETGRGVGVPGWGFGPSRFSCLFVGIKELLTDVMSG